MNHARGVLLLHDLHGAGKNREFPGAVHQSSHHEHGVVPRLLLQGLLCPLEGSVDNARRIQELFPLACQHDQMLVPIEQLGVEICFKGSDMLAQRRLGNMKLVRGGSEAQFFRKHDEFVDIAYSHGSPKFRNGITNRIVIRHGALHNPLRCIHFILEFVESRAISFEASRISCSIMATDKEEIWAC